MSSEEQTVKEAAQALEFDTNAVRVTKDGEVGGYEVREVGNEDSYLFSTIAVDGVQP